MRELTLAGKRGAGKTARVSETDYKRLAQYVWYLASNDYVVRREAAKTIYLHRDVLGYSGGLPVDHIDGDKLNNQRGNLRVVTASQSVVNRAPYGITGYKGVQPTNGGRSGTFVARLTYGGKKRHLGSYPTAEEAARAYDREALRVYGPHARLNFPEEVR